jgi:multidrug efflux pump subunit AcrB
METGVNVLDFTPRVQQRVEEWQNQLPIGYQVDVAFYQAKYVADSVNGVAMNLVQTLVTVLAVVMIFLGLRTGLIVGTIVPLTMIVTLVWMRVLGLELHRITLATLIISLGLLVDNGIVMAEEVGRRMLEGEERRDAAINAGKTLALPLLTSTLTTILAFVPLAMAPNVTGEYLSSMATVIAITSAVPKTHVPDIQEAFEVRFEQPDSCPRRGGRSDVWGRRPHGLGEEAVHARL